MWKGVALFWKTTFWKMPLWMLPGSFTQQLKGRIFCGNWNIPFFSPSGHVDSLKVEHFPSSKEKFLIKTMRERELTLLGLFNCQIQMERQNSMLEPPIFREDRPDFQSIWWQIWRQCQTVVSLVLLFTGLNPTFWVFHSFRKLLKARLSLPWYFCPWIQGLLFYLPRNDAWY